MTAEQRLLARDNLGLVIAVVKSLHVHAPLVEEACAEGMLVLCEAAVSHKLEQGSFSNWAWVKIRWRLMDWMTKRNAHALGIGVKAMRRLRREERLARGR